MRSSKLQIFIVGLSLEGCALISMRYISTYQPHSPTLYFPLSLILSCHSHSLPISFYNVLYSLKIEEMSNSLPILIMGWGHAIPRKIK